MTTGFDLTEAAVSFNADTEVNWNSFPLPIPENVLTFATDTLKFKLGDGIHHYHDLTNIVTLAEISAYHQEALNTLVALEVSTNNRIITISNELFSASSTSLVDIKNRVEAIVNNNTIQDANIAAINSQFNSVNTSIGSGDNDKLVVVGDHKMQPGETVASIIPITKYISPISILSVAAYSDQACTVPINELNPNSTYYVKIDASHNTIETTLLNQQLVSNNIYTTIIDLGHGLFRIKVSESPVNDTVAFISTISYDIDSVSSVLNVSLLGYIEQPVFGININVYSNIECTEVVDQFAADASYYAKITASFGNIDISTIDFNLSISNQYVMTTDLGLGVFRIDVTEADIDYDLTLNASVSHGTYNVGCSLDILLAMYIPAIQFDHIDLFSDAGCTMIVNQLSADTTYYAKVKVIAPKTPVNLITFTLTDNSQYTTITHIGDDVFKIDITEPLNDVLVSLTGNASYKTTSVGNSRSVQLLQYVPVITFDNIGVFGDAGCTVSVTQFEADTSYYAKVNATYGNLTIGQVTFTLTDNNVYSTITHVSNNVFKIDIAEPPTNDILVLTGAALYSTASASGIRNIQLLQYIPDMSVTSIGIFSNVGCTDVVTQFAADSIYYAKINATFGNLNIGQIAFTLTDSSQYTTITSIGLNIFKIEVAEPASVGSTTLIGTASYSSALANKVLVVTTLQYVPTISISGIDIFSDADCTIATIQFAADTTYYAKINAIFGNLAIGQVTFGLTDNSSYTTITSLGDNLFKINVAEPLNAGSVTLTGTASYSITSTNNVKDVPLLQYVPTIVVTSIDTYSDAICSTPVSSFAADTSYYAKVNATYGNLTIGQIAFSLSDVSSYTTITPLGANVFKIDVTEPAVVDSTTLIGTASYSTALASNNKVVSLLQYVPTINLTSIGVYSDAGCTINATSFAADTSYYAKVNATFGNLDISQIVFSLSDTNSYTMISHLGTNIFKIDITEPLANDSITLTGTASYSTASATGTATITLAQYVPVISITGLDVFSDSDCIATVASLAADTTYYAKIVTSHGNLTIGQLTYDLSANSGHAVITPIGLGIFKIDITEPSSTGSVIFTGTASYSTASANSTVMKSLLQYVPTIAVTSVSIFSDAGCTVGVTQFAADTTYYAKVNAIFGNLTIGQIGFGLSDASTYTTISPVSGNVFKIDIGEPLIDDSTTLTGTAAYSTASASNTKDVTLLQYVPTIVIGGVLLYSDAGCTVTATQFEADTSYYVKINASIGNLSLSQVTYGLTDTDTYTTITHILNNKFRIDVAEPLTNSTLVLTGTASYSTSTGSKIKNVQLLKYIPTIVVTSVDIYSDAGCTVGVSSFAADTTYYAKISATYGNLNISQITFAMNSDNIYITPTEIGNGVFSLAVTEPLVGGSALLTGIASYSTASANNMKAVTVLQYIPAISVVGIGVFSDVGCTTAVTEFAADTSYYAKVNATYGNLTLGQVTFGLSDSNSYTTISLVANNVFKIDVAEPSAAGSTTLTGTASYSTASANNTKVVPLLQYIPTIAVTSVNVYSDAGCTVGVSSFAADTTYYTKITATFGNLNISQITFGMSSNSAFVTPTAVGNGVFSLAVTEPSVAGSVILTGTASYSTASANNTKTVTLPQYIPTLTIANITPYYDAAYSKVASVFSNNTSYYVKVVGTFGNLLLSNMTFGLTTTDIHCTIVDLQGTKGKGCFRIDVGVETSNDTLPLNATMSYSTATVNSSINIIVNKPFNNNVFVSIFNGSVVDFFQAVAVDTLNNIICVGYTTSEGAGLNDALIVKYDSNFNVLYKKVYGGTGIEIFYGVTTDSSNNIVAVGSTTSEGANGDALIVKFDPTLTILAKLHIGTTSTLYSTNYTTGTTLSNLPLTTDITMVGKGGPRGSSSPSTNYTAGTTLNNLPLNTTINVVGRGGPRTVAGSGTNWVWPANYNGDYVDTSYDVLHYIPDAIAYGWALPQLWSLNQIACSGAALYWDSENGNWYVGGYGYPYTALGLFYISGNIVYGSFIYGTIPSIVYGHASWTLTAQGYTTYNAGPSATETINGTQYTFPGQAADGTYNNTTINASTGSNPNSTLTIPAGGNLQVSYTTYTAGTSAYETINGTQYTFPGQAADGTYNNTTITQNTGSNVNSTLTIPTGGNINVSYSVIADKIDIFYGVTTDHVGNFIAVGGTTTEGSGLQDGLVIKFDTNLNILYKKVYGGAYNEQFNGVAVDSSNNVICVGYTNSEAAALGSPTYTDALVVKLDSSLNLVARKIYGGATNELFNGITNDSLNNIICVGSTDSEGGGSNALVVKFDSNLTIVSRKIYGGAGVDSFFGVDTDSSNNIICAGYTLSEGLGGNEAILIKFDSNLAIISRKCYGGTANDVFRGVVCDSANNIICAGNSATAGTQDGLLFKSLASLPTGSLTGTIITNMTLADSNLTLANSALTLGADTLALANSALIVTTSTLTLNNSVTPTLFDILY